MLALEAIVAIGIALIVGSLAAPRLRIPLSLLLVVLGVLLGFVPALRDVQLPAEAVLLLFLPAILFSESLTTSWRDIRLYIRVITLNGTLLVVVTAFAVASVGVALGMPWAVALVLGAALAPTDATALADLGRALPARQGTVLKAESLINDGTALVIFALAVSVATGAREVTALSITWALVVSVVGGVAVGLALGALAYLISRRVRLVIARNLIILVLPFAAFLAAELITASGVLAVVVCGLVVSQLFSRLSANSGTRDRARGFWSISAFSLNGALFVLIGLELQSVVRDLPMRSIGMALLMGVVVWLALVVTRFAFIFGTTWLIRLVDRRPIQRQLRTTTRGLVVGSMVGFRGAVSLAAALAIPLTVMGGAPFPDRNLIVFVTAVVVVLTLAVQGPLVRPLVRWAGLHSGYNPDDEYLLAVRTAAHAAQDAFAGIADELHVDPGVRDRVREEVDAAVADADTDDDARAESAPLLDQERELRLALLARRRQAVVALRDQRRIDDRVLRRVESELDLAEVEITGREIE